MTAEALQAAYEERFRNAKPQTEYHAAHILVATQEEAGIDVVCDGELYRFDVNHPDTNGMIEYFVHKLGGIDSSWPLRTNGESKASANR